MKPKNFGEACSVRRGLRRVRLRRRRGAPFFTSPNHIEFRLDRRSRPAKALDLVNVASWMSWWWRANWCWSAPGLAACAAPITMGNVLLSLRGHRGRSS